ncbi:MAG: retropepsin-like aspartic protease [Chloroflexota bacterium]
MTLKNILLDTGSAGSVFSTDKVLAMGLTYELDDVIHSIRGVGGSEFVFTKTVDELKVDRLRVGALEVEIGAMDYGFEIDGIIGMDFLAQVGAVVDLSKMEIRPAYFDT